MSASGRIRAALTAGTGLALVLGLLGGAQAGPQRSGLHAGHALAKKEKKERLKLQVPLITVSIADQRLTLYDKGEVVAHAPVSTGMPGHPTPTGVFSVLGKEIYHRSNIYSGAPMPYMQRITWSGIALHAGVLPGYPASHGCIRMPPAFAVRLYGLTQRGARVIVTHGEVAPVRFENPRLFTLLPPTDTNTREASGDAPGVKTAETRPPAVMSDATDTAARTLAGAAKPVPVAAAPAAEARSDVHAPTIEDAARAAVKDAGVQAPATTSEPAKRADAKDASASPATPDAARDAAKDQATKAGPGTVLVKPVSVVPSQPIAVKKTFEPVGTSAPGAPTLAPAPAAAPTTQAALEPYGPERPLRPGPITVFVSKKEGKVYVRKGFQPLFDDPVTIAHPELALGTHLYTAVAVKPDGTSFDWVEVTVPTAMARKAEVKVVRDHHGRRIEKTVVPAAPPPATASQALDRIEIPPDALARISALMSAGATLIVSDQGLGSETGTDDTDFVVLTR